MSMAFLDEHNFSGGPGVLPASVLLQVQQAILQVPELGISLLGVSHRSDWFAQVVAEAESHVRYLLNLEDDFAVLFLQGGATQQFSMVPMTFLAGSSSPADYLDTGYWSHKSLPHAACIGPMRTAWSGQARGYCDLPVRHEVDYDPRAPYMHYVSNETVEGLQFHDVPGLDSVPRVCDMSSDFLSRWVDMKRYALVYAHAQKNLGPAGVTLVLVRKSWLAQSCQTDLPDFLDYRQHMQAHSILNTPPVFAIYVVLLVLRWLRYEVGGLDKMQAINAAKAGKVYNCLERLGDDVVIHATAACRSQMNAVFHFSHPEWQQRFLDLSQRAGFIGLEGHRSVGGVRISMYNAMQPHAIDDLVEWVAEFCRLQG
ncbi:MAG: 3-phosphoserine/phosphohydroxythreonine transaminase [Pseudomonadales bacterium]|nr:3-phosphoserine/phosphohydroxythreonine transaminase [Pseudomonadales bacterium]